jgi:tRNA pseudouridine38-40 synthase
MPRFKLTIEYDGAPFAGWQRQKNGLSVQEAIETALAALCGESVLVRGAGRTDAGVHALGQVAHVDLAKDRSPSVLRDGLNAHLRPHPVAILAAECVPNNFDARFSAIMRHYLYRIVNRRAPLTVERGRAWLVARKLDAAAMQVAAKHLIGRHDFSTFRSAECQASNPVRTLERLDVLRAGDEIHIKASARSTHPNALDCGLARTCGFWPMERRRFCRRARRTRPEPLRRDSAARWALSHGRGLRSFTR